MNVITNRQYLEDLTDKQIKNIFKRNRTINKDYKFFIGYSKVSREEALNILLGIFDRKITIYNI